MAKLLMKNYPLIFSLILIHSGLHGQPLIKVFGFEQESSRGTVAPNVKDENGNPNINIDRLIDELRTK